MHEIGYELHHFELMLKKAWMSLNDLKQVSLLSSSEFS